MKPFAAFVLTFLALPSVDALAPNSFPTKKHNPSLLRPQKLISEKTAPLIKEACVTSIAHNRQAVTHKKWGVDNAFADEYWYDKRIHTLGNVGFWGAVHAACAPLSTKLIDVLAYEGVDIRQKVSDELKAIVRKTKEARVLDLCCGVGISTRALRNAFPEAKTVMGIDTSSEMVEMAKFLTRHLSFVKPLFGQLSVDVSVGYTVLKEQGKKIKKAANEAAEFVKANAEDTKFPDQSFDLVTVMYAFHEAPKLGREKILKEARRLLQPGGTLAVIDISTDYKPSSTMLKGEPYVLEYQKNIHHQLESLKGFLRPEYKTLVPGHVGMWILRRSPNAVA
jgi:ubiquinone/menaquinone biosynthesis C-methylase UbiE